MIFILGKPRSFRVPKLGFQGTESPGWFDVRPKNSAGNMIHEQVHCRDEAANHQLPKAAAFWIIWMVSTEECSSLTQTLMEICCSTCPVMLNAMATQYTRSLNGVYHPHWLVQWGGCYLCMHIPVCSPWLPRYIDVTQTIFTVLPMAGLFPVRPCMLNHLLPGKDWYISSSCHATCMLSW